MIAAGSMQRVLDSGLEATIVGSFTKLGYGARNRLYGLPAVSKDLSGVVVAITGGTSGIGRATARGLTRLGAEVHLTSRNQDRADTVAKALNSEGSRGGAVGHALDTGDPESIANFATTIEGLDGDLDVLINNAGALTSDYRTDERGIELTLSSHLIGHYLLTTRLRPHLAHGARVLFMSSGGMYSQGLNVDEIEVSKEGYTGAVAYAKAKRGQVELTTYLGPRWAPQVIMHAMHPGWVDTEGVASGLPAFGKVMGPLLRPVEQGADTMIWLAATGGGDAAPGQFWLDRRPRRTAYLPGTGTSDVERSRLVEWLDRLADVDGRAPTSHLIP